MINFMNSKMQEVPVASYTYKNTQYPSSIFTLWTDSELNFIDIFRVKNLTEIPENYYAESWTYEKRTNFIEGIPLIKEISVYVPQEVTRAQGMAALVQEGYYQQVIDYINSLEGNDKLIAEIAFYQTNTWNRNSEFLTQVAAILEMSEDCLDNLFITASSFHF